MADEDTERRDGPSRRRLLAKIGSVTAGALAGCSRRENAKSQTATPQSTTSGRTPAGSDTTTSRPTTATDTSTRTVETWSEGGPTDRSRWRVTFQDDFAGDSLDWETWELGFGPSVEHNCAGSGCAVRDNVSVQNDRLVLTTTPEGAVEIPNDVWLADSTTGAVTPGASAAQTFGYFEAKAKLPAQPGGLPAFWAWSPDGNPPEIDFYEVFGEAPSTVTTTVHVDCNDDGKMQGRGARSPLEAEVDEGFHVFGCEWEPDHVAWSVDGSEIHREGGFYYRECHTPEPMFPVLNTHVVGQPDDFVGPDQAGSPADADYPYTHEFEWVRVWQREEW